VAKYPSGGLSPAPSALRTPILSTENRSIEKIYQQIKKLAISLMIFLILVFSPASFHIALPETFDLHIGYVHVDVGTLNGLVQGESLQVDDPAGWFL